MNRTDRGLQRALLVIWCLIAGFTFLFSAFTLLDPPAHQELSLLRGFLILFGSGLFVALLPPIVAHILIARGSRKAGVVLAAWCGLLLVPLALGFALTNMILFLIYFLIGAFLFANIRIGVVASRPSQTGTD